VFRRAYDLVKDFTVPVVVSQRLLDGSVSCSVGSAVVLNDDGWLLTAAHMLGPLQALERQEIRNCSYWFGVDGWAVPSWEAVPEADLAVGHLTGFEPSQVGRYPVFQTGEVGPGRSVCRLGFPFHAVEATYDEANDSFALAPGAIPIPRFPNEGIVTRFLVDQEAKLPFPVAYVETSSPGLRGQSGGPIFDPDGHVWGIQSRTNHLPLGFDPVVEVEGTRVTEHQFMNVGVGTSAETVLGFLRHVSVAAATAED
jgi:hypothetical protein